MIRKKACFIKRDMLLCMDDEDGFVEMLNDVTLLVTDIVAEETNYVKSSDF